MQRSSCHILFCLRLMPSPVSRCLQLEEVESVITLSLTQKSEVQKWKWCVAQNPENLVTQDGLIPELWP